MGSVPVLVERPAASGDVALHLRVFVRDAKLARCLGERSATIAALPRLAAAVGSPVLAGDHSLDPSAWLLIHPSGEIEPVTLDDPDDGDDSAIRYRRPARAG